MQTGTKVSLAGHGALILLALIGLPSFGPDEERAPIRVTDVSFVSEAEFDAAQAAAPEDAPREAEAPAILPAPRPSQPPAEAEPVAEAPAEAEVAAVEPPSEPEAPEVPDRIVPKVVTLEPPTAASPPRPRPSPRVAPEPTPAPPEAVRPAELPKPAMAPEPDVEVARVDEPPAAPPETAPEPEAEAVPRAPLALATSGRPEPRRGNQARRPPTPEPEPEREVVEEPAPDRQAEAVLAALQNRATPPTEPSVTEPTGTATSLPAGPPLTNSEKDGLKFAIRDCWVMPAGLRDAGDLKITVAAELAADGGIVASSVRMIDPARSPDPRFDAAYGAARRALIRCSPYELPRDKYAQWRNIEVVFNPEGMVSW